MTIKMSALVVVASLALAFPLQAAVLQLDFGPTEVTGDDRTNSPYHAATGSTEDLTWNQVEKADVSSGLFYSDGSTADGLGVDLGVTSSLSDYTVDLDTQPANSKELAGSTSVGVYSGTSVGRDVTYNDTAAFVGMAITGLAPGTYEVYVTARNTNVTGEHYQHVYAGAGSHADFDMSSFDSGTMYYKDNGRHTDAWVEDDGSVAGNYVRFSVTLDDTDNDTLLLGVSGTTAGDASKGFVSSVQVVPEPASLSLIGIGSLLFLKKTGCGVR